jgi:hypothetical protein
MLRLLHEQGRVEGMETAFHTKSGKILFSSLSAVIVEIGGAQCVLTTSQDITERRRAADRLRQSEEKYRSRWNWRLTESIALLVTAVS